MTINTNTTADGASNDFSQALIFVGAGGHAVSCADVALAMGYQKFYFVDPLKAGQQLLGFPVIASVANVFTSHTAIFVAVGDNGSSATLPTAFTWNSLSFTSVGSITTNGAQQRTNFLNTDLIRLFGGAPTYPGLAPVGPPPAAGQ